MQNSHLELFSDRCSSKLIGIDQRAFQNQTEKRFCRTSRNKCLHIFRKIPLVVLKINKLITRYEMTIVKITFD